MKKLKQYAFCYKDYQLGLIEFDEEKGSGQFTYSYTSDTAQKVPVHADTVVNILEEIRYDISTMKFVSELEQYVRPSFGKFCFKKIQ